MHLTPRQTLLLLTALAATLSAAGFVLEYGFNVLPCRMCWWQRYAHYGIFALSLIGYLLPMRKAPLIASYPLILISCGGLAIAIWQTAAQQGWLPFPASCTANPAQTLAEASNLLQAMSHTKIVPCESETFTFLGLSLAAWNIPAMLTTFALSAKALFHRT